jgi:SAM-dependent methyltransferase
MASVQEHYERLLGPIYTWTLGDIATAVKNARVELAEILREGGSRRIAVDLGAGSGAYAIPLAQLGFTVFAIDTNEGLLDEIKRRAGSLPIKTIHDDLSSFGAHCRKRADVILCMGDTLTHLPTHDAVDSLLSGMREALAPGGMFAATFRDYVSVPLKGASRFIPVRCDDRRILTCFLEYHDSVVMVHDLLHVRGDNGWETRVSAYPKLRLDPAWVLETAVNGGLTARLEAGPRGMVRLVCTRG